MPFIAQKLLRGYTIFTRKGMQRYYSQRLKHGKNTLKMLGEVQRCYRLVVMYFISNCQLILASWLLPVGCQLRMYLVLYINQYSLRSTMHDGCRNSFCSLPLVKKKGWKQNIQNSVLGAAAIVSMENLEMHIDSIVLQFITNLDQKVVARTEQVLLEGHQICCEPLHPFE